MKNLIYLTVLLLLAGCSGTPSSRKIENKVEESLLQNGFDQVWTIDRIDHINGILKDDITYLAIVEYGLTFKIGMQEFTQTDIDVGSNSIMGMIEGYELIGRMGLQFGQFEAGDSFELEEEFKFIKMDKGWELVE